MNKRVVKQSSRTAAYTCFSRGCATRETDPRFRGQDFMAEMLFPPLARFALNFTPLRRLLMRKMFPPGIYEYVFARTKVMDIAFMDALESGYPQIVLLGAGFDTRAWRFANRNQGTTIFELDAPTTQQDKIKELRKKNIPTPGKLVFVPIDFDRQEIYNTLSEAGYKQGIKTLFIWEGVSMYLTARAVDNTLEFIRCHAAPGSRLVFDYIHASVLRRENRYYGEKGIFDTINKTGEGWSFGVEDGEIEPFLAVRGFKCDKHYASSDLERAYLTNPDGTLHARINGTHCIVLASKNGGRI